MGILFGACLGFPVARTNTFPESLTCLELDFLLSAARKHPTGYPSRRCVGNTVLSLLCLGSPIKVSEKSHNSLLTFVQGRVCQLYLTEETFFPQYLINIWQDTCVPKPTLLKGMPWIDHYKILTSLILYLYVFLFIENLGSYLSFLRVYIE